jgi:hypothetical protein
VRVEGREHDESESSQEEVTFVDPSGVRLPIAGPDALTFATAHGRQFVSPGS